MFSGGDSSEGLNQLGAYGFVNQVAVSNAMAAGKNIDWAQLAQQWIQMRDNALSDTNAVSKMNESKTVGEIRSEPKFEEKGEADMDMDDEEQQSDEKSMQKFENSFPPSLGLQQNNINQPWFFGDATSSHLDPQPTNTNQWSTWPNQGALQQQPPNNSSINNNAPMNPTAHIPSLLKMNVPHPNEMIIHSESSQNESTNMMDSAKRKVLPAWIREGLEKMEREKQKQLEKEKQTMKTNNKWSDDDSEKSKDILNKPHAIKEEEDNTDEESFDNESSVQNIEASEKRDLRDLNKDDLCNVRVGKTYEQKLEDLMQVVRRTLTELLLETTNEEISNVAEETIKLFRSKASSAQVIQKSALSTITGKLGLAAYADSSSEESSDNEGNKGSFKKDTYNSESDIDSEEELRNTIRTKRRAFAKISDEIEERILLAAAREEEKLKYFSRKEDDEERERIQKRQEQFVDIEPTSSGYSMHNNKACEKDFGEITETKIQNFNGKRQKERNSRKERTSRFSDNKEKYVALPAAASFIANINAAGTTGHVASVGATTVPMPSTNQRQNIPDINGLLPNYASTGMKNVLNAADAALEKVLKRKSSESPKTQSKRYARSRDYTPLKKRQRHSSRRKHSRSRSRSKSNSSTSSSSSSTSRTSSDSESSSSRSSHHSKYSHRTSAKHKSHSSSDKNYSKSHKDRKDHRKHSSSSYTKKGKESGSGSRYSRNASSDSSDEYSRQRRHDSHYSRSSSHSHRYTSSGHDREHSRSLSRSSYSSSNRRQ